MMSSNNYFGLTLNLIKKKFSCFLYSLGSKVAYYISSLHNFENLQLIRSRFVGTISKYHKFVFDPTNHTFRFITSGTDSRESRICLLVELERDSLLHIVVFAFHVSQLKIFVMQPKDRIIPFRC